MLVDCDALSRYNTITSTWRDNLPENKPRLPAALAWPKITAAATTSVGHSCGFLAQLPPIATVGHPYHAWVMPASNPYIHRSIITWHALGTPIYEALAASGVPSSAFVQLEDDIPNTNSRRLIINTSEFLSALHLQESHTLQFDWFFGVCNVTPTLDKTQASTLRDWCTRCIAILRVLTTAANLGSAILIAPAALFPNLYQSFSKIWKSDPINSWHLHQHSIRGQLCGDPVTSFHHILYLGPYQKGPTWKVSSPPGPMKVKLPLATSSTLYYRLRNATLRNASTLDQEVHQVTPASISAFTKNPLAVPAKEYPLFSADHPAPSITYP